MGYHIGHCDTEGIHGVAGVTVNGWAVHKTTHQDNSGISCFLGLCLVWLHLLAFFASRLSSVNIYMRVGCLLISQGGLFYCHKC